MSEVVTETRRGGPDPIHSPVGGPDPILVQPKHPPLLLAVQRWLLGGRSGALAVTGLSSEAQRKGEMLW